MVAIGTAAGAIVASLRMRLDQATQVIPYGIAMGVLVVGLNVITNVWLAAPFLVILGDALGIYGGYLVGVKMMRANPVIYEQNTFQFLQMRDIWSGAIKAAAFGLILTLTGCVRGYYTTGGAEGVGRATTDAVVSASLIILLSDFFLTKVLF